MTNNGRPGVLPAIMDLAEEKGWERDYVIVVLAGASIAVLFENMREMRPGGKKGIPAHEVVSAMRLAATMLDKYVGDLERGTLGDPGCTEQELSRRIGSVRAIVRNANMTAAELEEFAHEQERKMDDEQGASR